MTIDHYNGQRYARAILTALRERCFGVEGAAPTGDEGKEGEHG
jgi:hypothetical protein